jgi:glyoxylase-like metal-dependent hydrolase (beta-lactamase superfamily II)
MRRPDFAAFFDPRTYTMQYVVSDPQTKACTIIDPVVDFDEKSGSAATHNADTLLDYVRDQNLHLQ